ncbi:hypothetical protein OAL64_01385 [bacterium]|nr:hypothetical protein [bacterium]
MPLYILPRRHSFIWLCLPVIVLCWNSTSHGGLAIRLVQADTDSRGTEMSAPSEPTSNEAERVRIENQGGEMHSIPEFNEDTPEYIAATANCQLFTLRGGRLEWVFSRVESSYVSPLPLVVPIGVN